MKKFLLSFLLLTGYQVQAAESYAAQAEQNDGQEVFISFSKETDEQGTVNKKNASCPLTTLNQFGYFQGALEFHEQHPKPPITCPVFKDVFDNLVELIRCETEEACNAKLGEYTLSDLVQLYLAAHFLQLKDFNQNEIQFNRLGLILQALFALLKTASLDDHDLFMLIDSNPALKESVIEELYKRSEWSVLRTLQGHTRPVRSAAFSPDGTLIVTTSGDETVSIRNAQTDETAKIWDAQTGVCLRTLRGHNDEVYSVVFSPNGESIATASKDYTVKVWDARTAICRTTLQVDTYYWTSPRFSSDGALIVTTSGNLTATVWNARTGVRLRTLQGHTSVVNFAVFNSDSSLIVTASDDLTAKVWNSQTGACLRTLQGHTGWVNLAAFSPDGTLIVTASLDRTANVWNAQTGACLRTLQGHTGWVNLAAFSPDGTLIVTASRDNTARIWDTRTGVCLHTLQGHTRPVRSAAFSPDSSSIVTASFDDTTRIWNVQTGECISTLRNMNSFKRAEFSPNGQLVVTSSGLVFQKNNFVKAGLTSQQALNLSIKEVLCVAITGQSLAQVERERLERDQRRNTQLKIGAGIVGVAATLAIAYKLWNWSK